MKLIFWSFIISNLRHRQPMLVHVKNSTRNVSWRCTDVSHMLSFLWRFKHQNMVSHFQLPVTLTFWPTGPKINNVHLLILTKVCMQFEECTLKCWQIKKKIELHDPCNLDLLIPKPNRGHLSIPTYPYMYSFRTHYTSTSPYINWNGFSLGPYDFWYLNTNPKTMHNLPIQTEDGTANDWQYIQQKWFSESETCDLDRWHTDPKILNHLLKCKWIYKLYLLMYTLPITNTIY